MSSGMEEIEEILDPTIPLPPDAEPSLKDILPRGYLSVSQMNLVLKCPHQFYLRYIEQLPQKTSVRPFQGIQVHKAVETVLGKRLETGVLPSLEMAQDVFSDTFEDQKKLIEDWEGEDPGQVKDTGQECVKHYYREAAAKATPVSVEDTFHTTIETPDKSMKIPVLGRIDSIQVQTFTEDEYQSIREKVVADYERQRAGDAKREVALPPVHKPLKIVDLKVVTDKWSQGDLDNDLQFAIYAGVKNIPDVQVDQLVKGRAKVPRPRYEQLTGVMTNGHVQHAVKVAAGVAKIIGSGAAEHIYAQPDAWWCGERWCSMWHHCRGKNK